MQSAISLDERPCLASIISSSKFFELGYYWIVLIFTFIDLHITFRDFHEY